MSMFICQHLKDGIENQLQEMDLLDLPELEFIDVGQVRNNTIPQILQTCCFFLSSWCISIDPG